MRPLDADGCRKARDLLVDFRDYMLINRLINHAFSGNTFEHHRLSSCSPAIAQGLRHEIE
jgi:hypothetical protein